MTRKREEKGESMLPDKNAYREEIPHDISDRKRSKIGEDFARLQRELKETNKSMLVIVDGWESSGKGMVLKDLTRELDPKYYEVSVFESPTDDDSSHPYLYRFFMKAPYEGQISFFDRSFYHDILDDADLEGSKLTHLIDDVRFVEQALADDDTLIIKFFLHQTREEMMENILKLEENPYQQARLDEKDYRQFMHYNKYYDHFTKVLKKTDYPKTPWDILYVDGRKDTSRVALTICVERLELFLAADTTREEPHLSTLTDSQLPLSQVDFTANISDDEYDERLENLQRRAGDLMYQVYLENKAVIVAYEGTDAAGKGGNIERLTRHIDPRAFDVATTSGPTKHELAHHYLWRFYRDFPILGRMTIFDRSWYGRVLVERIEELTPTYRWKEAYAEINQMEHNLVHEGYLILKYLIIINKNEQLERFEDRAEDPDKQHKLTDEDWRNHEQFDAYKEAMDEMVVYTSTNDAPWKVVSGMSKKYARIVVLEDFIKRVSEYLEKE